MPFPPSIYYQIKPFLPWGLRLALRRLHAKRILRTCGDTWPIKESAGRQPPGWPGWPARKQFALVLTHDVEGRRGLERVRQLAELEIELGFRSSFNFVPEGQYAVPRSMRDWLTVRGFEVGVHDLRHDGKLYRSREVFRRNADRINSYLRDWNAVGFRSGFMLRNLDWLDDLDVEYDASTFDTDPFEPQPDGVDTIFPFWVPAPNPPGSRESALASSPWRGRGYVELPYTLVQDSSLFVVLQEQAADIWQRKLAWIAERGGMALMITHPDYMCFDGAPAGAGQFAVTHYADFLSYIRRSYANAYWHALPREVAAHARPDGKAGLNRARLQPRPAKTGGPGAANGHRARIWIDLDNTPHVPFFKPIARELEKRGYPVLFTARDAFQVCELADAAKLRYTRIGRHYGKNRLLKVLGIVLRAAQLAPLIWKHKPALGLSHGSRSQILLCNLLRIPSVLVMDYEYAKPFPLSRPGWEIVPEAIANGELLCPRERIRKYPGIKEDVYAPEFKPDPAILEALGLSREDLVVTVRPPATEAHYHNPESEVLFASFMERLIQEQAARAVLLPRNKRQEESIKTHWPHWFSGGRVVIPRHAVDGLNLLWHSDLVVSGGGTMNREAAALGVPVYSIFRGPIGAVDRQLSAQGRLVMIGSVEEVRACIRIQRRVKLPNLGGPASRTLPSIIDHVEDILSLEVESLVGHA